MNVETQTAIAVGAIVFNAGGLAMVLKLTRKDVNGIGRKMREQELWRWTLVRTLIEESRELDEAKSFARLLPR